jgi:hypothetical protein
VRATNTTASTKPRSCHSAEHGVDLNPLAATVKLDCQARTCPHKIQAEFWLTILGRSRICQRRLNPTVSISVVGWVDASD